MKNEIPTTVKLRKVGTSYVLTVPWWVVAKSNAKHYQCEQLEDGVIVFRPLADEVNDKGDSDND